MKRFMKVLTIAFVAFILTGCIKYNIYIDIKDENTKTYTMTMLVKEDTLKSLGRTREDLKKSIEGQNDKATWKTKEISETIDGDKYVGYEFTATGSTKDQLKVTKKVKDGETTYTLKIDGGNLNNGSSGEDNQLGDYSTLKQAGAEMNITIIMPGEIIKSNVGKIEKNKVAIDLLDLYSKKQELGDIEVVSKASSPDNTALYIGIGVGVVVIAGCAILVFLKKKKTRNQNEVDTDDNIIS